MLEGGCVMCSRWLKQKEMWKNELLHLIWEMAGLSCSLHLTNKCFGHKILFSPCEFSHFSNQKIILSLHIFHSHAAQLLRCLPTHTACPHLPSHWSKYMLHFTRMGWWGHISYQKGAVYLLVRAPATVEAMCDSWYALMFCLHDLSL